MFLRPNLPMLLWALIILILTLTPGTHLSEVDMFHFDGADLVIHALIFGVQGFLTSLGFKKQSKFISLRIKTAFYVIVICGLFGMCIEFIQIYIPGRGYELFDMFANVFGVILGYIVFIRAYRGKTWI